MQEGAFQRNARELEVLRWLAWSYARRSTAAPTAMVQAAPIRAGPTGSLSIEPEMIIPKRIEIGRAHV